MTWQDEYASKVMSAEDAVERFVPDGTVCFTAGIHAADAILEAILFRVKGGSLCGVQFWGISVTRDLGFAGLDVPEEVFRYHTLFAMMYERPGFGKSVAHVPVHFGDAESVIAHAKPDIGIIQVTPPDSEGYVNIGPQGITLAGLPYCPHVIAQVNALLPHVFGEGTKIPISRIDAFVERDEALYEAPPIVPSPEEEKVAGYVAERINDGDTIQVGIGGMGTAICRSLYGKRHLGCFSEMYSNELAKLQKAGVIDNSRKNVHPGVSIAGYSEGCRELYDYIDNNPNLHYFSYSKVCSPFEIAKNDNLISMNSAISVDLTGQVCAESIGSRQFTATGGQVGYVLGAKHSKGGKSFICMTSVTHTKNGPISKISATLAPGSAVTTLRNDVQYVVTEYGCVDLRYTDVPTRVRRLISIAHPDFRDKLEYDAKKLGILF